MPEMRARGGADSPWAEYRAYNPQMQSIEVLRLETDISTMNRRVLDRLVQECQTEIKLQSFCDIVEYGQPKTCVFLGRSQEVPYGENQSKTRRMYRCNLHYFDPKN